MSRLLDTPNPQSALSRVEDLLSSEAGEILPKVFFDVRLSRIFLAAVGGSGFLFSILKRNPKFISWLFLESEYRSQGNRKLNEEELRNRVFNLISIAEFDKALRLFKEQEYLRIGCRDLADIACTTEIMEELSDLAGACIQIALEFHWTRLCEKHGLPGVGLLDSGLAVIGLGKVSGRELNFSSDVDLMFLSISGIR